MMMRTVISMMTDSSAMRSTAAAGGTTIVDNSIRSAADPSSRTREFSYRRLSTPSSSSSVDCGTPRSTTGPPSRDAAAVRPYSDAGTATTPSDPGGGCGTSGSRTAETVVPDRPSRRRKDDLQLSRVELDQVDEVFRESSVCI